MMTRYRLMAFAAPIALLASPAEAARSVTFAFTSATPGLSGNFALDMAQVRPPVEFDADTFVVENVSGTFGGMVTMAESITFGTADLGGGLSIQLGDQFWTFFGSALFSGSTATPNFIGGTFSLNDDIANRPVTMSIGGPGAVPEPATWAMMVAGFGAVGFAMRRRTRVRVTYA